MSDSGRRRLLQGLVAAGLLPASLVEADPAAREPAAKAGEVPDHRAWTVEDLETRRAAAGSPWLSFFEAPTMRMGVYTLAAGDEDRQRPHDADEAYYVVSGRATLAAGDGRHEARPGSILFVRAGVEHRFEEIEEDLTVLVFFAASGSV